MSELLTTAQSAKRLGISAHYLRKHRQTGEGPKFVAIGTRCVRYRSEDLETWVADRIRTSTADDGSGL